jgi:alanyl-tRNA synthetase
MDIRKEFLEYFKRKDHLILPSSGLIPEDDPSVLLTTAGMQQFKPYYLGIKKPPESKIATVQKCFRTSDIERVGYSDQHLTFFEMLGNFAFADYFKTEAVTFAMDFLLNNLGISKDLLSVGIFAGDETIPPDTEAFNLWREWGIPENRIYRYGKSDNFWGPAGETGPCGPCTELYFDFGEKYGCRKQSCGPSCGCGRYLEIWNLVFTQYNFNGSSYEELPGKNIDTGMGLERIAAVINCNPSVFNTKLFKPVISEIEKLSGLKPQVPWDKNPGDDVSRCMKIIADHSRAVTFLIADGVLPSNESRGYILRRIIRRAVRFAKLINIEGVFLDKIAETVIDNYSDHYNELAGKKDVILSVLQDEENKFIKTLKDGSRLLTRIVTDLKEKKQKYIKPEDSFKLYDTFGFPVELTIEILNENGILLDYEKFREHMEIHSRKSREKTSFDKSITKNLDIYKKISEKTKVEFTGYIQNSNTSQIIKLLKYEKDTISETETFCEKDKGEIVLEKTPFYAEKGGAAGDIGLIKCNGSVFAVEDTQIPVEGLIIHKGTVKSGSFKCGEEVVAEVDSVFRKNVSKNHTATHMLQWALKVVAGKEIKQAGSFVSDERLRFDYVTDKVLSINDIEKLERIINERIQKDDIVRCFETTMDYAKEIGALALFSEKYGKYVRVVEIDNYSRELCGGVHVGRTGEIGLFKLISDASIGQNTRRIEAVTGMTAFSYLSEMNNTLKVVSKELEVDTSGIIDKLKSMKDSVKKLQEDLSLIRIKALKNDIAGASGKIKIKDTDVVFYNFTGSKTGNNLDPRLMGILGDEIINDHKNMSDPEHPGEIFLIFCNEFNNKPLILLQCSKTLNDKGINCSTIVREMAVNLKGGGGGKPDFAQYGGFDPKILPDAIEFIHNYIRKKIN